MKGFLHRLPSGYRNWRPYFRSRARQLLSRLWKVLAAYSVLILVLSAVLNILVLFYSSSEFLSPEVSGALEFFNRMFTLMALGSALFVFGLCFVLFLILSLHPKGRRIADKIFNFTDLTELEKLKGKVGNIESELLSVNKKLKGIESRLGSIEVTLKSLVSSVQKPKRKRAK